MSETKRDDVAAVAEELARSLWVEEFGSAPSASDAKFMGLVAICAQSLLGMLEPGRAVREMEFNFG